MKTGTTSQKAKAAKRAPGQIIKVVVWREEGAFLGYL